MDLETRLDEMRRDAEERQQGIQQDLDELAAREFIGEADDGSVQVIVDGRGSVREVRVDPKRLRTVMGDELGRRVIEAARAARGTCQEGTSDILEHLTGGDADVLGRLGDSLGYGVGPDRPRRPLWGYQ